MYINIYINIYIALKNIYKVIATLKIKTLNKLLTKYKSTKVYASTTTLWESH